MSKSGVVKNWNEEKGFGFIGPDDGGEDLFCHRTSLSGVDALGRGDKVRYDEAYDERRGKRKANNVTPASDELLGVPQPWLRPGHMEVSLESLPLPPPPPPPAEGWFPPPPPAAEDGIFALRLLDAPDAVEEAAKAHYEWLRRSVFERLGVDLRRPEDPHALHGRAITELTWMAASGMEGQKSVCFGLGYAFLTIDVGRSMPTYWDYLALVRTLDVHHVTTRFLLSCARRCYDLRPESWSRLQVLLRDMIKARWPKVERVVLALQRELLPGDARLRTLELASDVVDLSRLCLEDPSASEAYDGEAGRLTFLWLLRWVGALDEPSPSLGQAQQVLRTSCCSLASWIWTSARWKLQLVGPLLWWVLFPCGQEPSLAAARQFASEQAAELLSTTAPPECLEHLLSFEKQDQLRFILRDAAEHRETMQFGWFLRRHFRSAWMGNAKASRLNFADCILWTLTQAGSIGSPRLSLWSKFWSHGQREGQLAFALAAIGEHSGHAKRLYAQAALHSLLEQDQMHEQLFALVREHLPDVVACQLTDALAAKSQLKR